MKKVPLRRLPRRTVLAAALATLVVPTLRAQAAFPSRPLTLVVPFAPGGIADLTARAVAEPMARMLGQPVVVENKPGAGGMIAAEGLKREAPDGYTMMISNNAPFSIAPTMFKSVL